MRFKSASLESQFRLRLHPAVRAIARELDAYLEARGWHEVVVTHALRTEAQMAKIYGEGWRRKGKWSWHLVGRAVDIRNRHWTPRQRRDIMAFLRYGWPDAEVIMHDIGRGDHLHIAVPPPRARIKRLRRFLTRLRGAKR